MIVILVIGLLAAMAYPAFMKVKTHAQASRVANDFRSFAGLFEAHALDTGTYPPDASPGAIPAGMEDYIKSHNWTDQTPIGGRYDWTFNGTGGTGIIAAVSITGITTGDEPVNKLDEIMDDGDLSTGVIQSSGSDVIYIIE